jgi:hypothetical protein
MKISVHIVSACLIVILLSACAAQNHVRQRPVTVSPGLTATVPTQTFVTVESQTDIPSTKNTKPTSIVPPVQQPMPSICLESPEGLPVDLDGQIQVLNGNFCKASGKQLQVNLGHGNGPQLGSWIYALVAPFPTVTDGITTKSLQNFWTLGSPAEFSVLGMTRETAQSLEFLWGKPAGKLEIVPSNELSSWAWETKSAWAVVPFEDLTPRLKVISLDGNSPIQKTFQPEAYSLAIPVRLDLPDDLDAGLLLGLLNDNLPLTNRNPQKMASVILTGVTALVRATAWGMENEGLDKPAEVIGQTLREADITHVSNEASFATDCPDPQNEHLSLRLCSKEAYLETLQAVGTDVVELTGDHLNDWGNEAFLDTLTLYKKAGIKTFGGGADSAAASEPALFELNSNKIAFIGCNSKHVGYPMATATTPGALDCQMDAMVSQIKSLVQRGYMPIVGIQHTELSYWYPSERMQREFVQLAQAGAVIVSGSQAHRPQTFSFGGVDGNAFLHYGLGNLFFDQDTMGGDYTEAFIDHHVFYDGAYISTEVLTIHFTNSLTPVWANAKTRRDMLNMFFWTSGLVSPPW